MRSINICKYEVNANFPGYYYPVFSLVIVRENNQNIMGRIIGYSGNDKVIVQSKSGKRTKLKYSDVVFYEEPREPVMTLKEVERLARKYVNYYSKESNLIIVNDREYLIDSKVDIIFDTDQIYDNPGGVMATCLNYTTLEFNILVPYLQYASKNQIKKLLLHEVAHLIVGSHLGHDHTWQTVCDIIGGDSRIYVPNSELSYFQVRELVVPDDWTSVYEGVDYKLWAKLAHLSYKANLRMLGLLFNYGDDVLRDFGYYVTDKGPLALESDLVLFERLHLLEQGVMYGNPLRILKALNAFVTKLIKLASDKDNRDNLAEADRKFVVRSLKTLKEIKSILNSDFKDLINA